MIIRHEPNYAIQVMAIHKDGDWVTYDDYLAEVTALKARIAELESEKKPRYPWDEAPEWAMWAATDADGCKVFYENEPTEGLYEWSHNGGDLCQIKHNAYPTWRDSLEKRPGT